MSHNTAEKLSGVSKKIDFHKVTFSKEELQTVLECLVED
ncbi:MAG TPA: DegT/DnrJ/EryC1/StrS aminotransferase family protein, partial [Leptospiraceae bacterium]|nr:DegT/DnrJ/EryC1/StrS aminotransferase family protein [Leptospiraceae bacterium]